MGYLLLLLFFIGICFIAKWYILGTVLSVFLILIFIVAFRLKGKEKKELEIQAQKIKETNDKWRIELANVIIPNYNKDRNSLIEKYGNPTKSIVIKKYDLNNEIIVFEEKERVWINGCDYAMKDIINCTYIDNPTTIKGKITSTTQTNTGNMVKRAVVGDVLLGGAGAVIGGSTASKTTTTLQEDDKVKHDYTVSINVNNLTNPTIKIKLGEDSETTNEIVGLMNVIISRNK